MQQRKKKKDFAKNKKAFDSVLSYYRTLSSIGSISAINWSKQAGGGTPNPARPTPLDFKCEVDKLVRKIVTQKYLARFTAAYVMFEAETEIVQERLADILLGGIRHSFEQRLGEQFVQRKIWPVQGRGYFHSIRRSRGK